MRLNRRQFIKLSASTMAVLAAGLGVDESAARAAGQSWKLKDTKQVPAVCHFCAGGCGIIVHTKDDEVINIEGDPDHPTNQGSLCPKGAALGKVRHNPKRVTKPMYRAAGSTKFEEISWDNAIDKIANKVKEVRESTWNESANRTDAIGVFGSAEIDNEECYLVTKLSRLIGVQYLEHQARM
jgi:formate dehydrogenase major subunit